MTSTSLGWELPPRYPLTDTGGRTFHPWGSSLGPSTVPPSLSDIWRSAEGGSARVASRYPKTVFRLVQKCQRRSGRESVDVTCRFDGLKRPCRLSWTTSLYSIETGLERKASVGGVTYSDPSPPTRSGRVKEKDQECLTSSFPLPTLD